MGAGGFDREGKAKVRQRVFVSAIDLRLGRQRCKRRQRRPHLLRGTLEQAAAAAGKKRIAAEEHRRSAELPEQRNVAGRVARDVDHVERRVDPRHDDAVAA